MKNLKYIFGIILLVLVVSLGFGFVWQDSKEKKFTNGNYTVEAEWKLPEELNEISGIAWLSENEIAAVQDEEGVIFIYDLTQKKIINKIDFAGAGDYEGIALRDKDAYVLRSDGLIYEVLNFREATPTINTFQTDFSEDNNIETLAFDKKNNSLIVVPKDRDKVDAYKGLYSISLDSKVMQPEPDITIKMNDGAFKDLQKKKAYKTFNPSDLAIHPKTGEYFVLEGKNPSLLILDKAGTIKKLYELDEAKFAQPEGITFSPDGILYISNEAGDAEANILRVRFH